MLSGNKKIYMLKQTCSLKLLLKYVLLFTKVLKDLHMFHFCLVAVVGASRNKSFAVRMFSFYSDNRRILKFPFSSFAVYFTLKLLF